MSIIKSPNFAGIRKVLRNFKRRLQRPAGALNVVADALREHADKNFLSLGAHSGQRWSFAGERKYKARKTALWGTFWGSRPLGTPHDLLRRSYTRQRGAGHIFSKTDKRLRVGSGLPYAGRLATGGVGPLGERFPGRNALGTTRGQRLAMLLGFAQRVQPTEWSS